MRIKFVMLTLASLVLASTVLVHGQPTGEAEPRKEPSSKVTAVDYNRDILPILANNCFSCHGPADQKAGLRLDQRDHAVKPTRSKGMPIQPGKAAESELIRRILAADEADRMPPVKTKKTLTATEKELLRKWIDQGAPYKAHWAFVPPTRPALPGFSGALNESKVEYNHTAPALNHHVRRLQIAVELAARVQKVQSLAKLPQFVR